MITHLKTFLLAYFLSEILYFLNKMKLLTTLTIAFGCLVAFSLFYQIEAGKKKYLAALLAGAALGKKYVFSIF